MHNISRRCSKRCCGSSPPQTIISLKVQLPCVSLGQRARWWGWWLSNYLCPRIVFAACVENGAIESTPDDHFAGPHCRVKLSGSGRVGGAGGCPIIRAGIISPASVQDKLVIQSTPYNHSAAVQTAVCKYREEGTLVGLVNVQLFVLGLYLPPVFKGLLLALPPHTIISLPVHTAV